ncbi:MAG TPA: RIO1 family regulatory kinase/ATPase [Myxococcales bacterium]|nr:RIO1 family regulatory kinase/ATPase [Myxococcales bacterium]
MSLEQLLEDGIIDEALGRLKSGKEADVWLVRHRDEVLCAKVYKDRSFRSFKNNAGYKEGRQVRNTRTQRAMDRGSRFGQAAAEEAWQSAESDALHRLHAHGVRVPAPVLFYQGILLMHLVVDAHGHPAPRLIDAQVSREQAGALYADLRQQAVKMLCADLIHGDLSPYNVLLGADGPVIIDFPQVVSAAHNSTAHAFFRRDVENLRAFFARIDPSLHARGGDADEIWRAYVRRELSPDFVPSGRARERHPHPGGPRQHPRPPAQQRHGQQQKPQQGQRHPQRHGSAPQQQQHGQGRPPPQGHSGGQPRPPRAPANRNAPGPSVERIHRHTRPHTPPQK